MIKYALISVFDKSNLIKICKNLKKFNVGLIATSSTAKYIKKIGFSCKDVSSLTGFKDDFDGRVKTLHPKVHASLLFKRNNSNHNKAFKNLKFPEISYLIINFYPFNKFSKLNINFEKKLDMIDIGGPALLRSAAKNFKAITTVSSPQDYIGFINEMTKNKGSTSEKFRKRMAKKAFNLTSNYDKKIHSWFIKLTQQKNSSKSNSYKLRYGENPNQKAIYQSNNNGNILYKSKLSGKKLSYNNILDIDSAINCIKEFNEPTCAIIKHNNPCGVASRKDISLAFKKAIECDPQSAFGGVMIINRTLKSILAKKISKMFFEIVIAKSLDKKSIEILNKKKKLILIDSTKLSKINNKEIKSVIAGKLIQDKNTSKITNKNISLASKYKASKNNINDMIFALKVCKNVKSNSIVLAKNKQTVGIGAGQMSRLDSTNLALFKHNKHNKNIKKFVAASDGFFPFNDSLEILYKKGCKSIIQPKGSINDKNIINLSNKKRINLYFTNNRYFKH